MTTYQPTSLSDGLRAIGAGHTKISFAGLRIGDEGAAELAKALKKNDEVTWLALFDQELSAAGLKGVLDSLKGNKSIFHLDFGGNPVGDEGVEAVCNFCNGKNKTVEEIYMYNTNISDEGAKAINDLLLRNRVVRIFDINDNPNVTLKMKHQIAALLKQGSSRVPASPRSGPVKKPSQ